MQTKIESTGFMQLGKTVAVIFNDANYEDEVELQLGDYKIEVRDGKTYAVRKKPKYPTIYVESYREDDTESHFIRVDKDELGLYGPFIQLIRCRNVYWKVAGEQMGLDKPWEPDWSSFSDGSYPTITRCNNRIVKTSLYTHDCILAFPTEEMRDIFYENFRDLIEQCKEFL